MYGFGLSDGILQVNPKSSDKQVQMISGPDSVPDGSIPMGELSEADAVCSDGFVIFAAKNSTFGDNVLYKVDTLAKTGTPYTNCPEPPTLKALVPLYGGGKGLLIPRTDFMRQFSGPDNKPTESELSEIFDMYDKDGNGSLDMSEVASFWSDVFIQNTDMSDAAREESIATAVTETFAQFDSINQDGKIDKDEFLKHLKDVQFPSFPDQQLDPNAMTEMIDGHASGKQQTKVQQTVRANVKLND